MLLSGPTQSFVLSRFGWFCWTRLTSAHQVLAPAAPEEISARKVYATNPAKIALLAHLAPVRAAFIAARSQRIDYVDHI